MPLPSHRPTPFCLILAEAVLLTAQGQRFFTFLLKNMSLRGACQGLRVAATWQSQGMPLALFPS
jgi:hypothetical protein